MNRTNEDSIQTTGRQLSQARRLLAYGGLDGVIQRPLTDGHGRVFPHFAVSAQGYYVSDSTGQQFIDWVNGWGPVLLGYRHPKVEKAIVDQLQAGPTLSLMNPLEVEVAELIEQLVPCADMVAFGKNGSDAVTASVRIARAVTGKDVILQFGFHGFHDWYTCVHQEVRGVPTVLREMVDTFQYNDLPGLEQLFQKHADNVAAVIMEPVNMWMPEPGYLSAVRDLAHLHGALLIFDEMVTAFRVARGGAQELYDVKPDLACLGKGMANGMPLSAVVGSRNYMQALPSCGFGMTFRGETLSLAAAKASLEVIRDAPVSEHLTAIGNRLRQGFHELCNELGVKAELSGPSSRMTFVFHDQADVLWSDSRAIFLQECLLNGVMTNGNLLPSYAHDDEAVEKSLDGFRSALKKLVEVFDGSNAEGPVPIGGSMFGIKALNAGGFLEQATENENSLLVEGWLLLNTSAADTVEIRSRTGEAVLIAEKTKRVDLSQAFPNHANSEWAGFRAELPVNDFANDQTYKFQIVAIDDGNPVYECLVEYQSGQAATGPWSLSDGVLYL